MRSGASACPREGATPLVKCEEESSREEEEVAAVVVGQVKTLDNATEAWEEGSLG